MPEPESLSQQPDNQISAQPEVLPFGTMIRQVSSFEAFIDPNNDKFDINFSSLDNIYEMEDKRTRYIEFAVELFGFNREQAEQAYEQTLRMTFERAAGREKFADRPGSEDAIAFYVRVWTSDILSGTASRIDVLRNDPSLINAVKNRCNYLARTEGGTGKDYYPIAFPPPHGPDPTLPPEVERLRSQDRARKGTQNPRLRTADPK